MHSIPRTVIALCLVGLSATQAQNDPPRGDAAVFSASAEANIVTPAATSLQQGVFLATDGADHMREMRERYEDPAQRAKIRAEQKADLQLSHAHVGEVLGIDAATEEALIDLLTDQQMARSEQFFNRAPEWQPAPSHSPDTFLQTQAAQETKQIDELRALIGDERIDLYQNFKRTLSSRTQVNDVDARLTSAHKFTREQRERLVSLFQEQLTRSLDRHRISVSDMRSMSVGLPSREEMQRQSALRTIEANQENWRSMADSHRWLRDQAAAFLTAPQLASLEHKQTQQQDELKRWIEQARVNAGLGATIPERAPAAEAAPLRTPVANDIKVSIRLAINRAKPTVITQVLRNGESVTFDAGEGVSVEAKSTLYDDNAYDVRLSYYQESSAGRYLIGETAQMGQVTAERPPISLDHYGSGTVLTGRKAYAVQVDARVEPM